MTIAYESFGPPGKAQDHSLPVIVIPGAEAPLVLVEAGREVARTSREPNFAQLPVWGTTFLQPCGKPLQMRIAETASPAPAPSRQDEEA